MKVRFLGESDPLMLMHGKVYDVTAVENGWYRIVDEDSEENPKRVSLSAAIVRNCGGINAVTEPHPQ